MHEICNWKYVTRGEEQAHTTWRIHSLLSSLHPPVPVVAICHEYEQPTMPMPRDLKSLIYDDAHHSSHRHLDLHPEGPRFFPSCFLHKRRKFVVGFVFCVLSLLVPTYLYFSRPPFLLSQDTVLQSPGLSTWDRMSAVRGPPTGRFRGLPTSRKHCSSLLTLHVLIQTTSVMTRST